MNEQLLTYIRQEITRYMPVINYDKATINAMIEQVYDAIALDTDLPDKGFFSFDQFGVIVGIVQSVVNKQNTPPPPPTYMAERARLKIALSRKGLLNTVNSIVFVSDAEIQIWWQDAQNFDMYDSRVQGMANAIGLTHEQLKDVWDLANTIE